MNLREASKCCIRPYYKWNEPDQMRDVFCQANKLYHKAHELFKWSCVCFSYSDNSKDDELIITLYHFTREFNVSWNQRLNIGIDFNGL